MKKLLSLITLLACAGSLYAAEAGTLTPSSVTFEEDQGYVADTVISNTLQETGKAENEYQWWSAGSDEGETGTIKLYDVAVENPSEGEEGEGGEAAPASETEAGLSKYVYANQKEGDFVNLGPGNQYLNVETTTGKPLYRTLATWNNNFLWVTNSEDGAKEYWNGSGDPDPELQGTVWQKEYQVTNITDIAGVEIGSEGKVIDTLVQFTASETAPELADGDKLVVWLKQQTEDDKPTDWQDQITVGTNYVYTWTDENEVIQTREYETALTPEEMETAGIPADKVELTEEEVMQDNVWPCFTNLMVTAGQLNDDFTVVKQDFKVSESVEPDKWYRLTIRAIENVTSITGGNQPGFAIYLDGVAVACIDDDYQTKLLNDFDVAQLSSTAKDLYNNKQLFISAVSSDKNGATALTAVGFDGTGKIDDLTINTVEAGPQFAMGKRIFKVEWDNGLTGFTIVAKGSDGNEITNETFSVEGGAVAKEFDFAAGAETYVISNLAFASGSTLSEVTATGAAMVETSGVYSFTNFDFAPVVKIGVDTVLATVDGTEYSNFEDAIAAATNGVVGTTLKLAADVTLNSAICVASGSTLIIDLAGKSIYYTPTVSHEVCIWEPMIHGENVPDGTPASITVLDSVGGGKIGYTSEAVNMGADQTTYLIDSMLAGQANVTIGTANDKGATFDGMVFLMGGTVYSGKFMYSYNPTTENNLLGTVAQGSEGFLMSEDSIYWVVTNNAGGETPDPIEYTITISGVNAANATVEVDDVAYDANATYKYTGTAVEIVATANNGYTYTDVSADGWTIAVDGTTATYTVSGITADVEVTVPAAVTKPAEGLDSWDDVNDKTAVSDVLDSATQTALAGSNVTALEIKAWAVKHNVPFDAGGISVSAEALMLNCADEPAVIAAAKDDFKVDDTMFNEIMENLENFEAVDFSSLATKYPCAKFEVIEFTLGEEASENAKFYKLKMTLK